MFLLSRLKQAIKRRRRTVEITPVDDVYCARVNGTPWHIPYPDESQAIWCMNLLDMSERYLPYINAGDTVIEAGAATGEYTVAAANRVGDSGQIHSFEAEPKNYACLRKNIDINNISNRVTLNRLALSDQSGETLSISVADKIGEHQISDTADRKSEQEYRNVVGEAADNEIREANAQSTTVDDYCENNNIGKIDILKLTVNGHEATILNGAKQMLESTGYVFLNVNYSEAVSMLQNNGFEIIEQQERDDTGYRQLWENTR